MKNLLPILLLLVTAFHCGGCSQSNSTTSVMVDDLVDAFGNARLIAESDVQHVLANATGAERAVVYVHLDWSFQSIQYQPRYAKFIIDYHDKHPDDNLLFHFADCTSITNGYALLKELPGWNELKSAMGKNPSICGAGELIWIEKGRVVHVQPISDFVLPTDLITKTETLLPNRT